MSKERRLDRILDIIAQNPGVNRSEIEAKLKLQSQHIPKKTSLTGNEQYERGNKSEERVAKLLESLWFVESVRKTEHSGWEDQEGRDLIVNFGNFQSVSIQVKSSLDGIKMFLHEKHLTQRKLVRRKLILLNGQRQEDFIKKEFIKRLIVMDNYWRNKRNSPILSLDIRASLSNK